MVESIVKQILRITDVSRFGTKDKIFLFKELSYLLEGGVSLFQAVQVIGDSTDNFALKEMMRSIAEQLNAGKPLSYCLWRLPRYFDQADITIVKSGETGGNLDEVMKMLASEYSYLNTLQGKYVGALMYPSILLVISIFAVIMLFTYILPGVFDILTQFDNVKLPIFTQRLIDFTHFLTAYGTVLAAVIWGVVVVIALVLSTQMGQKFLSNLMFDLPLIGQMTKDYYLIKFCRYMRMMLASGMNYLETFQLLKQILVIPAYDEMIGTVIEGISRGQKIYDSMKYYVSFMPANVLVLMKVGEETANLKQSLDNVVAMYEEELNNLLNNLSKIIEPVLIIVVGWVIAMIALSVFGIIGTILDSIQTF